MKRHFITILVLMGLFFTCITPVFGQDEIPTYVLKEKPTAEAVFFDATVMRPLGLVSCALGLAATFIAMPFTVMSQSGEEVAHSFLEVPFTFTFTRKMGDMEYNSQPLP